MDGVAMKEVESSNIEALGHDPETFELFVRFRGGSTHIYSGVSAIEFDELLIAPSVGSHFHHHIKSTKASRQSNDPMPLAMARAGTPHAQKIEVALGLLVEAIGAAHRAKALVVLTITFPGMKPVSIPVDENTSLGFFCETPKV